MLFTFHQPAEDTRHPYLEGQLKLLSFIFLTGTPWIFVQISNYFLGTHLISWSGSSGQKEGAELESSVRSGAGSLSKSSGSRSEWSLSWVISRGRSKERI